MDSIIVSIKQSVILSNLNASTLSDYSLEPGAPLLANSILALQPQSTSSAYNCGNEISFIIPQSYHCKSMMLRSNLTTSGSNTTAINAPKFTNLSSTPTLTLPTSPSVSNMTASTIILDNSVGTGSGYVGQYAIADLYPKVGLRIWEYISITTSSGRELFRADSRYLRAWVESLPAHRAIEIYKKAMLLDPLNEQPIDYLNGSPLSGTSAKGGFGTAQGVVAGTQLVTYTPIPFFEIAEIKSYFDLAFCESIIVRAKLQSNSAKMGFALNELSLPTFQAPSLQMSVVKYDESYLRVLRNANFSPGTVLQIYFGNASYTEVFQVSANTSNNSFSQRLNNTYPATAMFIYLSDPITQIPLNIQSVSFNVAGQVIFDASASHLAEHSALWRDWNQGGYVWPVYDPAALDDQVLLPITSANGTLPTNGELPCVPGPTKGGAFVLKSISQRAFPFVFNLEPADRFKCTSALAMRQLNGSTITVNLTPPTITNSLTAPAANSLIMPNYELAICYQTCEILSIYSDSGLLVLTQLY